MEIAGNRPNIETAPSQSLEVPYVRIIRNIVHEKIPEHRRSFDITLDEINRQMLQPDGLFVWHSKDQLGVSFLAGHLSVTPDLIKRIAVQSPADSDRSTAEIKPKKPEEQKKRKIDHYMYVIEPYFGLGEDGSAISGADIAIARFIAEMPTIARAIKAGENPPTIDIYMVGSPTALGGHVTPEFVERVKRNGFSEHGKLYAEFVREQLRQDQLDSTRAVIQGGSKGAITSDKTFKYLPKDIQERTQLLYDTPTGTHGKSVLERTFRTYNMGVGMATEVAVRQFAGLVRNGAFVGQKEFYRAIAKLIGIPEDSKEQKRLKKDLFLRGEVWSLAKGTPLDRRQRSFSRISIFDPVNIDVGNIIRVVGREISDGISNLGRKVLVVGPAPRRAFIVKEDGRRKEQDGRKEEGGRLAFATGYLGHNFPWIRSIDSGAWARKMKFVENSIPLVFKY